MEEALPIDFVNKIVEPDNLVNEVMAIAELIVANGHASIRGARSVNNTDLAVALPC